MHKTGICNPGLPTTRRMVADVTETRNVIFSSEFKPCMTIKS